MYSKFARIVKHAKGAQASKRKYGHERMRLSEFPRETRPMLCIGKTPDL